MRNKDMLFAFDDMAILMQYLYMDPNNKILIHNAINVPLEISMYIDKDECIYIKSKNLNFPDVPAANFTESFHPETMHRIIEQLKTEKAIEFPDQFNNRWEEIKTITKANLSLNIH